VPAGELVGFDQLRQGSGSDGGDVFGHVEASWIGRTSPAVIGT
jgi:hypothetical protein